MACELYFNEGYKKEKKERLHRNPQTLGKSFQACFLNHKMGKLDFINVREGFCHIDPEPNPGSVADPLCALGSLTSLSGASVYSAVGQGLKTATMKGRSRRKTSGS